MIEALIVGVAGALHSAAVQQNPDNPLNIPLPSAQEMERCLPPGITARTPISRISRAQMRAALTCMQALMVTKINSVAPLAVDEVTILTSAESSGTTLQYNYRVAADVAQVTAEQRAGLVSDTRSYVCGRADMVRTIGHGGAYRYVWNDRNGRPILQTLIDDCG